MTLFALVRRMIAAKKSWAMQLGLVIVAIALAANLRWLIDRGSNGVPFVTFIPLVVLAAIFLEWRYAVLAAVGSLITVAVLFGEEGRFQPTIANAILCGAFTFIASFMIVTGHILRRTILELDAQTERVRIFNAELQHRTKNTLQMVRALASRASRSTDPMEFYATLSGRLNALAKANELLGVGDLQSCELADLVSATLQPFPAGAIHLRGPRHGISGEPGTQLMLALHELGTNAMKYGALSADGGTISITWGLGNGTIELDWRERGGPPVTPPVKTGLGSRILSPGGALRAVDMDFRPEGLNCHISLAST